MAQLQQRRSSARIFFCRTGDANGSCLAASRIPCRRAFSVSGAEEHEPERAKDQYRKAGGDHEEGEHRWPGLGLPRFGRGFDGLTLLSRCHAGLDFLDVAPDFLARDAEATHDFKRCSGFCGEPMPRRMRSGGPFPAAPVWAYCPARDCGPPPRLTPLGDSRRACLKPGSPVVSLAVRLLRSRSIPWPPAPTGKVSCAFRS